jgi:signal transduction histidine kinase
MTKWFTLLFIIFYGTFSGISQNTPLTDSLESLLPSSTGSDKMYILSELAWQFYYTDIDKSYEFSKQEIQVAKQLKNDSIFGVAYNDHGRSLYSLTLYDSAISYYRKGIPIQVKLRDSLGLAKLYNKIALSFQLLGKYDSTAIYYYKSIELFDFLDLQQPVALLKNNIAGLMMEQENYEKSLDLHLQNLTYRREVQDTMGIFQSLNGVGNAHSKLKQHDKAIKAFLEGIELAILMKNNKGISTISHNLGTIYLYINDFQNAKKYLNKAIKIRIETNDHIGMLATYTSLGKYYYKIKDYKNGIVVLSKAKLLADQSNSPFDYEMIFQYLAELHYAIGNADSAYYYQVEYTEMRDSIRTDLVYQQVAEAEAKFQVTEKEKALLIVENEKAKVELLILEKSRQLWFSLGGVLLILLGVGFIFYRTRQQQKSKLAQIRIEEQQKGLAAVIQVQENERKRIAKDLHDGIVQQLGGLKLGLQKIFTNKETDETNKIVSVLDKSAQELRELSHKMMPRSLSELGLIPALQDMLDNSLGHANMIFQFEHFGITGRFKEYIEIAIYRIAQELINNVIKHSSAQKVNVQLFKSGDFVILIVEDDGKGMDLTNQKDGIGLMNISSRLDIINGKVNFEPSPKSGTLATVKIPIG